MLKKPKLQMSSFDIVVMVQELNEMLSGAFINKIYQPEHDELIIRLSVPKIEITENSKGKYHQKRVYIKVGNYLCIEEDDSETKKQSQVVQKGKISKPFAMLLRKYLKNGKIVDIRQYEFDRLIEIVIEKQQVYKLIIEMFGNGNIILTVQSEENTYKILQPLFPKTWKARELRAGEIYEYPPKRVNIFNMGFNEFQDSIKNTTSDLVRTLAINVNIGGTYAEEVCKLAEVNKNANVNELDDSEVERIFNTIQDLINKLNTNRSPTAIYVEDEGGLQKWIDIAPIDLKIYDDYNKKYYDTYNHALNDYFTNIRSELGVPEQVDKQVKTHQTELERLTRQLGQQREAVEKFELEVENYKHIADSIYVNFNQCQAQLEQINEWHKELDWDEIVEMTREMDEIVEVNPYEGYFIIKIPDPQDDRKQLSVKLDYRRDLNGNAASYYERSKKSKEKLTSVHEAILKTEKLIERSKAKYERAEEEAPKKLKVQRRKTFWFEKYRWFISSDGNLVIAGKDAGSNEKVVKKHLKDHDRYAHADIVGAPSVVVKLNEGEDSISEITLEEACRFAVIYSKAWNSKLGSAGAYWVKPDQVSKTPPPGEFVPRGAFMIRGKHNFHHKLELKMAVGEVEVEGEVRLMGGPVSAVKAKAENYIIFSPGEMKKSTVANKLSKLYGIPTDEILKVLPPGNVQIIKAIGVNITL
jgi:predicted ribosome quality control (RQC) complex YloA/Tae2 family protein